MATDASADQVANAEPCRGVEFVVAPAEASALPAASVDLVTVAQALHWFNVERFFEEVDRVLRPGGALACWSYARCQVSSAVDVVLEDVYATVEDYWPPERAIVENRYRDIRMPWRETAIGPFSMQVEWTAAQMLDYMNTWSASQRFSRDRQRDPLAGHADRLVETWGDGLRAVRWPLVVRAATKPSR